MANSLTYYIGISVSLMFLIFMVNMGMDKVAEEEGLDVSNTLYNYEGSHIQAFDKGNYTLDEDIANNLPTGSGTADVDENSGNIFTDTFKTIKNWLLETTGAKVVLDALNTVPNFLKRIFSGDFGVFAFAIGYLWQVSVIFAVVFWLKGGNN